MVVGYDVAVCADDDTRTCSLSLRSLNLLLACSAISLTWISEESEWVEETSEWIALHIYGLHLRVLNVFDMYHGWQSLLCCVSQIYWLAWCLCCYSW